MELLRICSTTSCLTKSYRRWPSWYIQPKVLWMLKMRLLPSKRRKPWMRCFHLFDYPAFTCLSSLREKRDWDGRKVRLSLGWHTSYTPLNALLDQVLIQIKDDLSLKWPKKMKGDLSKWNKSEYCCFYQNHGHDTDECYDLNLKQSFLKY